MSSPHHLLIRADAGGTLGIGHVMRMIALAQAWQERCGRVTFASCRCPDALVERIREEGMDYHEFGEVVIGSAEDLMSCIQLGESEQISWMALDGYRFDGDFQKSLKVHGFKVLAVDDYGHCEKWHADLVLNQNIQSRDADSGSLGNSFLIGSQYALLRREFRDLKISGSREAGKGTKLLVTFGGVDPTASAVKVLHALNELPPMNLEIKVLGGPANPNIPALRDAASRSPHHVEIVSSSNDMPSLYTWAERIISAGGSSCYEWLLFRRPGWVTSVAENQHAIVEAMLDQGIAAGIQSLDSVSVDELGRRLLLWIENPVPQQTPLVDGWGALRVAAAMADVGCWVRPVDFETDARFLFHLANEPTVRSAGYHSSVIAWDDHVAWLKRHIESANSCLMMVEKHGKGPIGQIRFHRCDEGSWEVGVSINPDSRGGGNASQALRLAIRKHAVQEEPTEWIARIRKENRASQALFAKLDFVIQSRVGDAQLWTLRNEQNRDF